MAQRSAPFWEACLSKLWRLIPIARRITSLASANLQAFKTSRAEPWRSTILRVPHIGRRGKLSARTASTRTKSTFAAWVDRNCDSRPFSPAWSDAAPLNFVLSGKAREKDFKVLAYTGDFVSDVQLMVAAPMDKIKRSPEEVYKFIKATVKARKFQFENQPEAYKFYLELERLIDTKFARDGWEARLKGSSPAARLAMLSNAGMLESIVTWKEQMALAGRPLKIEGRTEDVYDFSLPSERTTKSKRKDGTPRSISTCRRNEHAELSCVDLSKDPRARHRDRFPARTNLRLPVA